MMSVEKAELLGGGRIEYVVDSDHPMEGGMKQVFFTPDRSAVVCFFKDQTDVCRRTRLEAVLGKYNATMDPVTGSYFRNLYCWPTAIVLKPRLGVMVPAYPKNYFFRSGPWTGLEKQGKWFTGKSAGGKAFREMLPMEERGPWVNYLRICILMARAVRRLHQAGLAHSDLSPKNVLVDPTTGQCIIIDIDSLVVPRVFPPDVLGTRGYIAPEVLATLHLPLNDPRRQHPCAATDQHALAVLLYEYLLLRHPLIGPKTYPAQTAEEQERLEMGEKALFTEHPVDRSNRPRNLKTTCADLGPHLQELFTRTFVDGLHQPFRRPGAIEWERGLQKTWDLLYPCPNDKCRLGRFVAHGANGKRCPFCRTSVSGLLRLALWREGSGGQWVRDGVLVVYHGLPVFRWHTFDNVSPPNEASQPDDKTPVADCHFHQGRWILVNRTLPTMMSPHGHPVPYGQAVELKPGERFRFSSEPHGRCAEVEAV